MAAVVTYVKAGYFDEIDNIVGIAHVLEHMYFKGTPTRGVGEIAKQTKASGGLLNASTIYDHTRYYAVLPSVGFAKGLEIQADAYANSVIDAEELERELEVIIEEARRKADNPSAVVTETLFELLHDRHRIRRWRIGREEGLRALTRDQLLSFYRSWYRPSNTILAIVGDVDADTTIRQVEQLYGSLADQAIKRDRGPAESEPPGRRYRELVGDVGQTHIAMGWRVPGSSDPDTVPLDLVSMMLGSGRSSRLYRAVRERKLASDVAAYNYTPGDIGVFVLRLEGDSASASGAARAARWQVSDLCQGAHAAEVVRAQRQFEARLLRRMESMDGQANYLAEWESLGGWELGEAYAERMLSLTADEVSGAAARHLDPENAALVVYRPARFPQFASGAESALEELGRGSEQPLAPLEQAVEPITVLRSAKRERVESDVVVFETDTGVPILVKQRRGSPMVYLGILARGGASHEPHDLSGLSTLMTRSSVKGTARRSATAIAFEGESLGGSVSGSVGSDGLGWGISVPRHNLEAAVDLLADVVMHPAFGDAVLDTEREIALTQLVQLRDDMARYPLWLATEAAYRAHPYARVALGSEEGLRAAVATELRSWHRKQVLSGETVLAVVGDVEPDSVAPLLAGAFRQLKSSKQRVIAVPQWVEHVTQRVEYREKAQSALAMAFPAPARGDNDRFAAQLLATIASGLGGRFFDELRDRQSLAYTVHASYTARLRGGLFTAYIAMSPDKEDAARQGLLKEFARLREEPVRDSEIERARTFMIGTRAIARQSGGAVLGEILDAWCYGSGLEELGDAEDRIRAVTPTDIQELAQRYFDETRRVEGIVRGAEGGRRQAAEVEGLGRSQ